MSALSASAVAPYMPKAKVPIAVSEVTLEDDLVKLGMIQCQSFDEANDPIGALMVPYERRPSNEERYALGGEQIATDIRKGQKVQLKAIRQDTGEYVGFAAWMKPGRPVRGPKPETDEKAEQEEKANSEKQGMDLAFWDMFWDEISIKRERFFDGKDHWYLALLTVATAHQGIGAGRALMRWAIDQADAASPPVDMFLEASVPGRRLYEKLGFEFAYDCHVDWKGKSVTWPAMHRKARSKASEAA